MMLYAYKRAILVKGFGDGPIPVNTFYTESQALFADPLHLRGTIPPRSRDNLETVLGERPDKQGRENALATN
jgi:hypothetical protein